MKTIRWGIIGCGDVTESKSGPAFAKAAHSALVAVMRRDGVKAADYARRHNVPRWYDDGIKLIHDEEVDAVYVATPPDTHEYYATLAARAGKPVYVEKPMARSFDECVRMVQACKKAGIPLFVAYYRRSLPRFLKVKQLIDAGAIGRVCLVNVRLYQPPMKEDLDPANLPWRVRPEIAGAGRFLDLASHTLDLLDFCLGPIKSAKGHAKNQAKFYPAEDIVAASFAFETGVLGTGVWCFTAHHKEDVVEIVGDQGRITFATFGFADEPVRLESSSNAEDFVIPHPPHIQQPMIQAIVNELNGQFSSPSTGETAARTSRVMDQILFDWRMQNGRAPQEIHC
jgi:predicted dehydrogenase